MKRIPRTEAFASAPLTTFHSQISSGSGSRNGFTLLELMIVVVIIAILAGLLLPAAGNVIKQARNAGVVAEINQLEAAISRFKADHGIEPPSSITLVENGNGGANWDVVSAGFIRQIWPQYDFGSHDINGNGSTTDTINLTVGECLVFFLGGVNGNIPTSSATSTSLNNNIGNIGACTGFSKNPTSPFDRGGSREAPLFEFNVNRFTDVDKDGFPEYKDALPGQKNPYLYFSGYDGQGYAVSSTGATSIYVAQEFASTADTPLTNSMTQCYYQDPNLSQPWKPTSHQIISPGYDTNYGYGGAYIPKNAPTTIPAASSGNPTNQDRIYEGDNITNFSNGVLQP